MAADQGRRRRRRRGDPQRAGRGHAQRPPLRGGRRGGRRRASCSRSWPGPRPTWCCSTSGCPAVARSRRRALQEGPPVVVVAVSAETSPDTVAALLRAGVRGYLGKGRIGPNLPDLVSRCLGGRGHPRRADRRRGDPAPGRRPLVAARVAQLAPSSPVARDGRAATAGPSSRRPRPTRRRRCRRRPSPRSRMPGRPRWPGRSPAAAGSKPARRRRPTTSTPPSRVAQPDHHPVRRGVLADVDHRLLGDAVGGDPGGDRQVTTAVALDAPAHRVLEDVRRRLGERAGEVVLLGR